MREVSVIRIPTGKRGQPACEVRIDGVRVSRLCRQDRRILAALMSTVGVVSYRMLALAADIRSQRPERVVAVRVATLRKVVRRFGYVIENYRNLGYALVGRAAEEIRDELRAA